MSIKQGHRFGRYLLVERLGVGGMAQVYRAVLDGPQGFTRTLAIKRVLPEFVRTPSFVKMLGDEARLSALLSHPGIVQVYELGEIEGEPYIAMELVDGWDLSRLLKTSHGLRRKLPVGVAALIAAELASALAYAHALTDEKGRPLDLIHRDVSPSNVMITRLGGVKLLDFGIAKALSQVESEHTRSGVMKGKLGYLSPEQADGETIDRRADIFALGVVLHEMLTGQRLFSTGDDLRTLKMIREGVILPPSSQREGLDPALDRITGQLLARDPAQRYQHCEEVVAELRAVAHREHGDSEALQRFVAEITPSIAAEPQGDVDPESATVGEGRLVGQTAPLSTGRRAPRRARLAAALLLGSAAASAFVAWTRADSKSSQSSAVTAAPSSPPAPPTVAVTPALSTLTPTAPVVGTLREPNTRSPAMPSATTTSRASKKLHGKRVSPAVTEKTDHFGRW